MLNASLNNIEVFIIKYAKTQNKTTVKEHETYLTLNQTELKNLDYREQSNNIIGSKEKRNLVLNLPNAGIHPCLCKTG